ncbi:pyrimidine 5-nucleotidase [Mycena rosella]|uniref:Pyrimidine 5-nucleotidase n=1 Tax=Mycena rosella TaxID=1033263 RepID=A0AAD7CZ12_MYCRO|nr:pyrimidine 5-nucleotidase [Mycena rosella]
MAPEYFTNTLKLDKIKASELHLHYYNKYGLALRGLLLDYNPEKPIEERVDPGHFDDLCDGALPLEDLISPNPSLRKLLQDVDRSKASVWALTNAYENHAKRVLRILDVEDLIDGLIFCDYKQANFACKPEAKFYHDALTKVQVSDPSKCYFVDDNWLNVKAARDLGWGRVAHFRETGLVHVEGGQAKEIGGSDRKDSEQKGLDVITDLEQLRTIWAEVFK